MSGIIQQAADSYRLLELLLPGMQKLVKPDQIIWAREDKNYYTDTREIRLRLESGKRALLVLTKEMIENDNFYNYITEMLVYIANLPPTFCCHDYGEALIPCD